MTVAPWESTVPTPAPPPEPLVDLEAVSLGQTLATFIAMGSTMDPRSRQAMIGSSEIGWPCDRRVVYKLYGVPEANRSLDPLRRLIGTGVHLALAQVFRQLDAGNGFFLIEAPVVYRGVPGTADLVFRYGRVVIDWKSATKEKIGRIKREGPPRHYIVQLMMYAAALRAQGEDVTHVAIVWVPIDINHKEGLDRIHVWRSPVMQDIADDAVDRMERLSGKRPSQVDAKPDRLCAYCAHYNPDSTDIDLGCLGGAK